jgi:hypothetical protein
MGQPEPGDFIADYARLGARIGCDFEELKRCYRRAVRELHPDLHPDLAEDQYSQGHLRELLSAFRRLNDYHRHFGRLPGEPRVPGAIPPRTPPLPDPTGPTRRRPITATIVLLLAALGIWLLSDRQSPPQTSFPPARPTTAAPARIPDSRTAVSAPADLRVRSPAGTDAVRIGDDRRRVRGILGAPIVSSADTWDYGPSHVRFRDGRVVDWYSSPLKPIAVDDSSRKPAAESSSQ